MPELEAFGHRAWHAGDIRHETVRKALHERLKKPLFSADPPLPIAGDFFPADRDDLVGTPIAGRPEVGRSRPIAREGGLR